jgi:hypothetical protein
MYWWNVSKLAEDFQQDRVDEKERFNYYLATSIVAGSISQLVSFFGWAKVLHLITAAMILLIALIGIIFCHKANKRGDDADFVARMVCLSWPVGVKVLLLLLALCSIISVALGLFVHLFDVFFVFYYFESYAEVAAFRKQMAGDSISFLYFMFGILYFICYYRMLHKYVKIIASSK